MRQFFYQQFVNSIGHGASSSQVRYLRYFYCVSGEMSWRDATSLEQVLLQVLSQHLYHPYQQVREYISLFVSLVC